MEFLVGTVPLMIGKTVTNLRFKPLFSKDEHESVTSEAAEDITTSLLQYIISTSDPSTKYSNNQMDNNNMSLLEQSGDKTIIEHVLDVTNGNMVDIGVGEASIDPLHGTGKRHLVEK